MRPALYLTMVCLLSLCPLARADLLVVTNAQSPVDSLTQKQVVDLFTGRRTALPNGQPVTLLDMESGQAVRERFYRALTGQSEAQIDGYWAMLIFSGRMSPPEKMAGERAMLSALEKQPNAIGYVKDQALPDAVKVLLRLPDDS